MRTCRACLAVVSVVVACHSGEPLEVQYGSPQGDLAAVPRWAEVRFDQPIIDPDAVDPKPEGLKITIDPPLSGQVIFPTPSSLAFHFGEPVPPAQAYTLEISSGLRSADKKAVLKSDYELEFSSPTNSIEWIARLAPRAEMAEPFPTEGERTVTNLALTDRLLVALTYPEKIERLRSVLRVAGVPMQGGAETALDYELTFPEGDNASFALITPRRPWPQHTHLDVRAAPGLGVSGITAGSLRTKEPIVKRASTYGPLEVKSAPDCQMCTPPPTLAIEFSTPVTCDSVLSYVRLEPAAERLSCAGQPSPTIVRIEPTPALRPNTRYVVRVVPGVTDAFNQVLAAEARYELQTGDREPRFAYQKMFNVLERQQKPAHEEQVRDAASLKVEGARLAFADAWKIIAAQELAGQVAWRELPWWLSDPYYFDYEPCYWDHELDQEVCDSRQRHPGALEDAIQIPGAVSTKIDNPTPEGWQKVAVPLEPYLAGKGGLAVLQLTPQDASGKALAPPVLRLLNVTDIGLSARYSPSRVIVLAARLSDGKPVAGAQVSVWVVPQTADQPLGEPAATGLTDAQGSVTFDAAALAKGGGVVDLHAQGLMLAAATDDDQAFTWSRFSSGGRRAEKRDAKLTGAVYTERGVYRPGETVYFRVVARTETPGGFATPSGEMTVNARQGDWYGDEGGEEIFTSDVPLSPLGTLSGSFVVPKTARIGTYWVVASLGEQSIHESFQVAEFRRAEMKVQVNTDKVEYIAGDTLRAKITADYLFGAPAAGQTMRWSLRRADDYFESKRFPAAQFHDYDHHVWYGERSDYSEFLDEGEVTLDDGGAFSFERKVGDYGGRARMERLVVSGTVDDASGQSVSARATVRVHPATLHVGIAPNGYLKEAGKVFTYDVVAVTPTDDAASGVAITVSAYQDYWSSVKRQGPGGRVYWDYHREEIHLDDVCKGKSDARGVLTCQFTPKKGGDIRLRAEASDKKGRRVSASAWFWIVGDPDYYGARSDTNQVGLVAESPKVAPGDRAKIVITSPFQQGLALVTVEREDILWQKVMEIGTTGTVELPVEASWAPNVHISATVVRGRVAPAGGLEPDPERDKPAYALGWISLEVEPKLNVLTLKVASDKPVYEPGQTVTASVSVADHAGRPIAAEVNLYAVDEGVLMLTAYRTPDLIDALFQERSYAVLALDTRMHVLGRRNYVTPVVKGEEDGGGGGEDDASGELRQDFNPVAVWVGSLMTNDAGTATRAFEVPDTLTTYRLMAVAVGPNDRFGSGEAEFKTQKTLMLRQAMPRFARPGDRFTAGVVVNQLTGKEESVTVELESIDTALFKVSGDRKRTVKVGGKATVPVLFDIEAVDADGASDVIVAATMGSYRDRVKLTLPVVRLIARESRAVAGVLEPGEVSHTLTLPEQTRPSGLEVNLSSLPVASLEEKMRELVRYPYGCLEQRTSIVMPLVAVRELSEKLGFASIPKDQIKQWVDEWVSLVPKYRCNDDGFDYYPGCRWGSNEHLTAYALEGLLAAKRFGYAVPDELVARPASYLEQRLARGDGHGDPAELASTLRVLAEAKRAQASHENTLYESRASLPLFAKTDLVRAIWRSSGAKDARVATMMQEIGKQAVARGGAVHFTAASPEKYWWAWDSDVRATALVLQAMLEVEPADARVPLVVRGLVGLEGGRDYESTQEMTQSLLALAAAADVLAGQGKKPVATVKLGGGKELFAKQAIAGKVLTQTLGAAELGAGPSYPLVLKNDGDGPLYFGAFLSFGYPATARPPAEDDGFRIERSYTDRDGRAVGSSVQVGDYVMVNLQIWPKEDGRLVVIDDPLPAGLEPVDTTLATSDTEMAEVMEGSDRDWSWWRSQYREMRDDRTEWHFQQIYTWRGEPLKLRYLTRAVTAGSFYAPGTTAERMYQPHIRGRGLGRELVVKPK
jgi:alpha-2-macroglobulin